MAIINTTNLTTLTITADHLVKGDIIRMKRPDPVYFFGEIVEEFEVRSVHVDTHDGYFTNLKLDGPEFWQKNMSRAWRSTKAVTVCRVVHSAACVA